MEQYVVKEEHEKLEERVRMLEIRDAQLTEKFNTLVEKVDTLIKNISKLLWVMGSALVLAVINFILKGGLHLG